MRLKDVDMLVSRGFVLLLRVNLDPLPLIYNILGFIFGYGGIFWPVAFFLFNLGCQSVEYLGRNTLLADIETL